VVVRSLRQRVAVAVIDVLLFGRSLRHWLTGPLPDSSPTSQRVGRCQRGPAWYYLCGEVSERHLHAASATIGW